MMGIVAGCLASVCTVYSKEGSSEDAIRSNSGERHVKFANSAPSPESYCGNQDQSTGPKLLRESTKETIYNYKFIVAISTLMHFSITLWPKFELDSFDLLDLEYWKVVILNVMPFFVQVIAICAMSDLNKRLPDGAKLSSNNEKLTLGKNEFFNSLKTIVCLMSVCQILSKYSNMFLWSVLLVLPLWYYRLTSILAKSLANIAQTGSLFAESLADVERTRLLQARSPRKSWLKLGVPKSPKPATRSTSTQEQSSNNDNNNRATPRTRTRKAVKNFFTNVSDKYHTFEQSVAHTVSQRLHSPIISGARMIVYDQLPSFDSDTEKSQEACDDGKACDVGADSS